MSKHNYTQYSNKKSEFETPAITHANVTAVEEVVTPEIETVTAAPEVEKVVETVETVTLPETVTGVVSNCSKLNVRALPTMNSEVVCVLDVMSEIEINVAKSDAEWVNVCTAAGIDGYCMRKFVDAHL